MSDGQPHARRGMAASGHAGEGQHCGALSAERGRGDRPMVASRASVSRGPVAGDISRRGDGPAWTRRSP
jgi:hypothetical protein